MKPREGNATGIIIGGNCTPRGGCAGLVVFASEGPKARSTEGPKARSKEGPKVFLHRLAQGGDPGLPHQKAQRIDPRIEHEFNRLFMTTTKEGKEALIERWMARQKCGRLEAMRLAVEEWRRENR
jgi:hypothetical protein